LAQPFSTLSNVLVIALSLAIPILAAALLESAQPIVKDVPVNPEITLFMVQDAPIERADALAKQLQADHPETITQVEVVTRDEAVAALSQNPDWSAALQVLPAHPLPHAIVLTLAEMPDQAEQAQALASEWRQLEGVDLVQLDSEWVGRLEAILRFLRIGLSMLAIGVVVVVIATVFNTVRLQALTQREEIGVARLVGATESFVRRPFLYLGALTGLLASGLAIGVAALALRPLNAALERLAQSYGTNLALHMPEPLNLLLASLLVAILGALAARWSVTRNTRF